MRFLSVLLSAGFAGVSLAQLSSDPAGGPHAQAQAAADVVAQRAGTSAAFLPAGILKSSPGAASDLSALLQFPSDEIVVVRLKGKEITEALERSVANLPDANSAFLQLSGISVVYSASAQPGSRIVEVKIGDNAVQNAKDYEIAMPASLARGALGYFKIWDKSRIVRSTGVTLGDALKGKTGSVPSPRYVAR